MTGLAAWLMSLAGPLLLQALVALGVGVMTVVGFDAAFSQLVSWITTGVSGLPSDMANVLAIGGVFQGVSYILGAVSARVALTGISAAKRFFLK
ncbi:DUF2523 family protein [Burkholderia sp. Ax-1724]|uniref:DUF2523 family protein n=1 Tax=Burkholderia sp. Ax-1724 TaxID=2608336 RepID=UPI00142150BF|nr:DUF2523 family protein [Burkholderia sp. Ax-1724]NIF53582.1 DUF2523 domain-containing protein [Burkholderia sp. Ax-1724]